MNIWDPNPYRGDTQLLALSSYLRHEEIIVEEINKTMDGELREPLWIRNEHQNASILISTHVILAEDPKIVEVYK